jgi:hypothetical protein
MTFAQGYALLIGVGSYQHHSSMNVAITTRDAHAVAAVLRDERLCGYPAEQVRLLADGSATRAELLAALEALAQLDEDATVILFYAGHGEYGTDGNYYLTTHDTQLQGGKVVAGTGVSEQDLLARLRNVKARRLLAIFNACHAGEVSPTLGAAATPTMGTQLPEKTAAALLATGSGRVLITACREDQVSYVGSGKLTLFTQALVDGLQGKGDYIGNRGGLISAFDLYSHLYATLQAWVPQRVPEWLRQSYGQTQEPELTVLKGVGPFAVSLYRGATTLGGFSAPDRPEIDSGLREVDPKRSERLLNQVLQIQAGRDVTTAGRDNLTGAQIEGGYTGGDRTERRGVIDFGSGGQFGNLTFGDIAGGNITRDTINIGDITGSSGLAIGRGAQSRGRTIDTGGGDYAEGSSDQRKGSFVGGDQLSVDGSIAGSSVNFKSTLTNVSQLIGAAPHGDAAAKAQLQALIAQLSAELERAPAAQAAEAEAVAETAKAAVAQATRAQPNKTLVAISAEGLKQAAQDLAAALPAVLPLATKIAEAIQRFAT